MTKTPYIVLSCCGRSHGLYDIGRLPATPIHCKCGARWQLAYSGEKITATRVSKPVVLPTTVLV